MITTKEEVQTALVDIDSWAVQEEILAVVEERHSGDFADFFEDLEKLEQTLSINLYDVLYSISASKYDQLYNPEVQDDEGSA